MIGGVDPVFVTKCVYKSIKFGVTQTVEQKEIDAQRDKLTLAMRPKEKAPDTSEA